MACYEEVSRRANVTAKLAIDYAKEIHITFTSGKSPVPLKQTNLISSTFPAMVQRKGIQERRGFEGFLEMIRENGSRGYEGWIGTSISLVAELWSIDGGIKIAKEQGYKKPIVDTDSKVAVDILNDNYELPPHTMALVDDCKAYS